MIFVLLAVAALGFAISRKVVKNGSSDTQPRMRFREMLFIWKLRGCDSFGCGAFGASREGGKRLHEGADYVSFPGDAVFPPFEGEYVREVKPYADDARYKGMLFSNGSLSVMVFYVNPQIKPGKVKAGVIVGFAQNLAPKYKGITNHIHVEVREAGKAVDPVPYFTQEKT